MPTNFNFTGSKTINDAYRKFFEKRGYLPRFFNAYNCSEIGDIAPTITAACGISTTSDCVLVMEVVDCETGSKRDWRNQSSI